MIQPSSMQAVPNKLNRSGRSITTKYLRRKNVSLSNSNNNSNSTTNNDRTASMSSSSNAPLPSEIITSRGDKAQSGDSISNTSGGSSQRSPTRAVSAGKPVRWLDIHGVGSDSEGEDSYDLDDDMLEELRPRCQSESYSDRRKGCVRVKKQLSVPDSEPSRV